MNKAASTSNLPSRLLRGGAALLFPQHCLWCDGKTEGNLPGLCGGCRAQLMRVAEPFCEVCGEPFEGVLSTSFRCGNCAYRRFHFDFAIAAYRSIGPARSLVHSFKYNRRLALRTELGQMLVAAFDDPRIEFGDNGDGGLLVPVPLHHRKERERTFNQAEEIARAAARELGLPVLRGLRRIRYTETQAHMHRGQRLHNMRGAFAVARSEKVRAQLEGATVYLIDDVLTTGATAQECARILKKEGGVAKVVVVTVCRAAGFSKPKL